MERHKELDHAHLAMLGRAELPSAWRAVLSLRHLRGLLGQLVRHPRAPVATRVAAPPPGQLAVTLVGHATCMLTSPGARVLTDPYFSNWLWGQRRAEPAAIDPLDLAAIDLVLISHAHRDHLHLPSLRKLPRSGTILAPEGCVDLLRPLGFASVVGLEPGARFAFRDLEITALPARHDGQRGLFDPRYRGALGYFVKTPDVGAYYAGDTAYFSGFAELGRRLRPDVALLPITGYLPLAERAFHMSPLDAIAAFEELGASLLVPVGHSSFARGYEGLTRPLDWLRELASARGGPGRIAVLASGETCLVRAPAAARAAVDDPATLG